MCTVNKTTACSHAELSYVEGSSPSQVISLVCSDALKNCHYGHIPNGVLYSSYIFSASLAGKNRYGDKLAEYIRENKLGEVLETPPMKNVRFHPDHSNKVYIWVVDHASTGKWYKKWLSENVTKNGFEIKCGDLNDLLVAIEYGAKNVLLDNLGYL